MTLGGPLVGLVCETGWEYSYKAVLFLIMTLMIWSARLVGLLVGHIGLDNGPVDWIVPCSRILTLMGQNPVGGPGP